jgi:hypothetical protein
MPDLTKQESRKKSWGRPVLKALDIKKITLSGTTNKGPEGLGKSLPRPS